MAFYQDVFHIFLSHLFGVYCSAYIQYLHCLIKAIVSLCVEATASVHTALFVGVFIVVALLLCHLQGRGS